MDDTGSPGAGKGRDPLRNKAWWFGYYSPKRIRHQNVQIHMIGDLDVRNILEVGPAGGYVTALLANIGYSVTTLDYIERDFDQPDCPHVQCDLTAGFPALDEKFDLIICCETLEHIERGRAEEILREFHATGSRYLLVSVPFSGFMLYGEFMLSPHQALATLFAKWREAFRRYVPETHPYGHKWELGTRGLPVSGWEAALERSGWRVLSRRVTAPTRSVFHLCERTSG
jgi:hypothetical protein